MTKRTGKQKLSSIKLLMSPYVKSHSYNNSVMLACPVTPFSSPLTLRGNRGRLKKDSRQAGMTASVVLLIDSLATLILCLVVLVLSYSVSFGAETTQENPDGPILARVGDEVITQKDLETALKKMPERKREKFRDKTLDQLIEVKVFSNEARNAGLDKDPKTKEALEKATKEILAQQFIKKIIDEKSQPSEEDMKKYYSEHKEQFIIPEGVSIQQIVGKNKEDAEAILEKLKKGASFEEMAKRKSIARSYKDEGRLGWLYKGRMDPELEKAAFTLEKDKLSDVIKTGEGYQIIKVLAKSDKREMTFEEAKANIKYELFWKKKKELMEQYYKQAKVNKNPSEEGVLFKIGDEAFKEEILTPVLAKASDKEKEKVKQRWINYFIDTTVFSREATKAGLEKDPEVAYELKKRTDEVLAGAFQKKFIYGKFQINDKDVADYYQSHPEEFKTPLGVKIKTILVKTKEEADNILKELKEGTSFDTLAKEKSIHPSASKAGDIGWFGKGQQDPELEKAAFSLEKDKVSDVIKTPDGYQIIQVIDKKGGNIRTLSEVTGMIKMKLQTQNFQNEKQRYYEKAGVKIISTKN